jgi:hypothetical protein
MTLVNLDESTGEIAPIVSATPMEQVAQFTEWADALMGVVESRKLYIDPRRTGKKYLMVEAWELIGAFAGLRAEAESVEPRRGEDGIILGYDAKVVLVDIKTGEKRGGGAFALCGMDESVVQGQKTNGARHNACMSMAQTRATSKAFRINFSYVVSLGGYETTTAEEMVNLKEETKEEAEHWCEIHGAKMIWTDKQQTAGYPPSHRTDDGFCTGEE